MAKVFYVVNKRTGQALNQKGGWSESVKSYRVAEFDTQEAAEGAFLSGVDCEVRIGNRKDEREQK